VVTDEQLDEGLNVIEAALASVAEQKQPALSHAWCNCNEEPEAAAFRLPWVSKGSGCFTFPRTYGALTLRTNPARKEHRTRGNHLCNTLECWRCGFL